MTGTETKPAALGVSVSSSGEVSVPSCLQDRTFQPCFSTDGRSEPQPGEKSAFWQKTLTSSWNGAKKERKDEILCLPYHDITTITREKCKFIFLPRDDRHDLSHPHSRITKAAVSSLPCRARGPQHGHQHPHTSCPRGHRLQLGTDVTQRAPCTELPLPDMGPRGLC